MSTTGRHILLVEDDQNFGDVLRSYLEMNQFVVTLATDGQMGWDFFRKNQYDLCILDVMMPKKDGYTLAKDIRGKNEDVPIVFLTARNSKDDVLQGFSSGADDYLPKPFNAAELLARVQAILKRTMPKADPRDDVQDYTFGQFSYHHPLRLLTYKAGQHDEQVFKLSPKEADLLRYLGQRLGEVTSRSEALKKLWGDDNYFNARSMDVFLTKLRKYLAVDERIELINIHGSGFVLREK